MDVARLAFFLTFVVWFNFAPFANTIQAQLGLSLVGAGFVVGIRMVAEWFPPREVGLAEGVYGGWGNFGSAAAALTLPTVATVVGGPHGWRIAIAITGVVALAYGLCYLRAVSDTPQGRFYAQPQRQGALEVTSPAGVLGLILVHLPMIGVLGVLAWRLQLVGFLSAGVTWAVIAVLAAVFVWQTRRVVQVNRAALARRYEPDDQYPFRSVAILCVVYAVTFGSELAVVSMLPTFFADTFGLSAVVAGAAGSAYAVMNLVSRAAGGLFSDVLGNRRRTLLVLLLLIFAGPSVFFVAIGASAVAAAIACRWLPEPADGFAADHPDVGTATAADAP